MENELLKMLNERDESVLSEIEKGYGKMIYSLALRILGSKEDAEECLNDVLLEIWNTVPPYQPKTVSAYACMLARRTAIDRLRVNTAEKRGGGEYIAVTEDLESLLSEDGEGLLESGEIRDTVNAFLESSGKLDRYIFIARYYAFEEISEIADKLGMKKNAVNIRLTRMRKRLGTLLAERNIGI